MTESQVQDRGREVLVYISDMREKGMYLNLSAVYHSSLIYLLLPFMFDDYW